MVSLLILIVFEGFLFCCVMSWVISLTCCFCRQKISIKTLKGEQFEVEVEAEDEVRFFW